MESARTSILLTLYSCALLGSVPGQAPAAPPAEVPVITVCEALEDLSRYNGKSVVIVGRLSSTEEGSWLTEDCERRIVTEGYKWANSISTSYISGQVKPPPSLPTGFKWDDKILAAKLRKLQATTKLRVLRKYNYSDKWMAAFGRFEAHLPLQVVVGGMGQLMGHGFGHLGGSPAQLIHGESAWNELKSE